jgi:branched-chain amino acid aminotransferase
MAAGTAAALVPIKSITMRSRNDKFEFQGGSDEPGPACVKFLEQLQGIQRGKIEDQFGWCQTVKQYTAGKDYQTQSGVAVLAMPRLLVSCPELIRKSRT